MPKKFRQEKSIKTRANPRIRRRKLQIFRPSRAKLLPPSPLSFIRSAKPHTQ